MNRNRVVLLGRAAVLAIALLAACSSRSVPVPIPGPPPEITGENYNSLTNDIPNYYVGSSENLYAVEIQLQKFPADVQLLRTLVWPGDLLGNEEASTNAWVHAPLHPDEVQGLSGYAKAAELSGRQVQFSVGALWRMWFQWPSVPREMWYDADTIAQALIGVARQLIDLRPAYLDAYSEFHHGMEASQAPVMAIYWPAVKAASSKAGIPVTVSTILDVDDPSGSRAIEAYRWLRDNGGLPDYADMHTNGWSPGGIVRHLPQALANFKAQFPGLPVAIGECDVDLDAAAQDTIDRLGLKYFLRWVK